MKQFPHHFENCVITLHFQSKVSLLIQHKFTQFTSNIFAIDKRNVKVMWKSTEKLHLPTYFQQHPPIMCSVQCNPFIFVLSTQEAIGQSPVKKYSVIFSSV